MYPDKMHKLGESRHTPHIPSLELSWLYSRLLRYAEASHPPKKSFPAMAAKEAAK